MNLYDLKEKLYGVIGSQRPAKLVGEELTSEYIPATKFDNLSLRSTGLFRQLDHPSLTRKFICGQSAMMLLSTLVLVLVSSGMAASQETYSDKYDNVNVDVILRSGRLLKQYMACVLDKGPCSPDGRYFRTILPEALETNCEKCTDKMKANVRKVSNHIRQNRPEDWTKFVEKYDADKKYTETFERFLNA